MINGNLKASYAADERVLNNSYKQTFVYGMMVALALFAGFANDYMILIACKMGILLIAVVGVNILTGYTGLVSLGHGAFVAIGAYSVTMLENGFAGILPEGTSIFVVLPLAVAITADEIEFDAPCGGYAWRYTLDAGALQLSRTREPAASCLATARIHHAVFDTAAAIEAARRAERTPSNAIRLSGGGRSVELYTQ